ncbi:MAG: ornithine cyclodeaminase family protein [Pseudolabrys sp.]
MPAILSKDEIAPKLDFARLIPALAQGFKDFHAGKARVAPITNIDLPDVRGEMHIKPGYISDGDHVCVKIATCYYDNPAKGLPTRDGVIVLANRRTGQIEAVLCDGGLITDMRTAGASAVAVDALAKQGAVTLGLVGAGTQALWHARAIRHVRPLTQIAVWARRPEQAEKLARELAAELGVSARAASLDETAASDVVVTATPANAPILTGETLSAGAMVVAMGADAAGKRELGAGIADQATLIVADSLKQCRAVGELQWHPDTKKRVVELGAVLAGAAPGRQSPREVIIFDSTGVAFQDVVGAAAVIGG